MRRCFIKAAAWLLASNRLTSRYVARKIAAASPELRAKVEAKTGMPFEESLARLKKQGLL